MKISEIRVGMYIKGKTGGWTILGTPEFSHTAPRRGTPVYKVAAYWEGEDGTHKAVTLNLEEGES